MPHPYRNPRYRECRDYRESGHGGRSQWPANHYTEQSLPEYVEDERLDLLRMALGYPPEGEIPGIKKRCEAAPIKDGQSCEDILVDLSRAHVKSDLTQRAATEIARLRKLVAELETRMDDCAEVLVRNCQN